MPVILSEVEGPLTICLPPIRRSRPPSKAAVIEFHRAVPAQVHHSKAFRTTVVWPLPVIAADRTAINDRNAVTIELFIEVQMPRQHRADIMAGNILQHFVTIGA